MVLPKLEYFNLIYLESYTSSILYPISCLKLLRCSCFIRPREETMMHVKRCTLQGNYTYRKPRESPRKNQELAHKNSVLSLPYIFHLKIISCA